MHNNSSKCILLLKSLAYIYFFLHRTISLKGLSALCITYKRNKLNWWTILHFHLWERSSRNIKTIWYSNQTKKGNLFCCKDSTAPQINGRVGCMSSWCMKRERKNSEWKHYKRKFSIKKIGLYWVKMFAPVWYCDIKTNKKIKSLTSFARQKFYKSFCHFSKLHSSQRIQLPAVGSTLRIISWRMRNQICKLWIITFQKSFEFIYLAYTDLGTVEMISSIVSFFRINS